LPSESRDLFLLFADQRLLFLRGFDQQCGEATVIDTLGIRAVLLPRNQLRHDGAHFLGDDTNFVLAIRLQVVGDAKTIPTASAISQAGSA